MSKSSKFIVSERIPEWGLSPRISTAVPIAASGTEIKSTKDVSESMNALLHDQINRMRDDNEAFAEEERNHLKTLVAKAKHGQAFGISFKAAVPKSGAVVPRRAAQVTVHRVAKSRPTASRKRG